MAADTAAPDRPARAPGPPALTAADTPQRRARAAHERVERFGTRAALSLQAGARFHMGYYCEDGDSIRNSFDV